MPKLVAIEDAAADLDTLARAAEAGETIVLTRDGAPVLGLIRHTRKLASVRKGGLDWEAGERFLKERGISDPFPYVAPDFDDPLPEDFLLQPLPPGR